MKQHTFIQATYQMVVATIKPVNNDDPMTMVNQFMAPPGFRLHSHQLLKDTVLVGQPHKVLMVFEQVTQITQDIPDEGAGGVSAEAGNA